MINSHQNGSALIVSLMMLTSITLLAVVSLQSSTTQIRIITNLEIREEIFHTTRRELVKQYDGYADDLDKQAELFDAYSASSSSGTTLLVPQISMTDGDINGVDSTLELLNSTPLSMNFTFAKNSSTGKMSTMKYELQSSVEDSTRKFQSQQRMGFNFYAISAGK